ncbi:hypothetical protein A9W99_07485 [Mycobacterium sp. 1164966.3]|uniref:hypothetical protein n=1 Tax=Mycobacterium sp. 1164966.3 TaxID=1856861 RepID=UPI0007FEAF06|nr:hypothetical protein [Mycobacterium sp. 1164966.3]OBA83692.1 hypothetical protein A9W99_07485 [Mycobacterium sp. 1164966.3]
MAVLGAVTTAWDAAHAVIAKCGDRFLLLRIDSTRERVAVAQSTLKVIGREGEMREELKQLAAGVIAGVDANIPIELSATDQSALIEAADLVTRCRTAMERDYQSNPVMAHAPEAPTRFVKQLAQVMRGAIAIGHTNTAALRLALRVARDSMPPLRLQILNHLEKESQQTTTDVRRALQKPHNTIDRELQAMQLLGVVTCAEEQRYNDFGAEAKPKWRWSLAPGLNPGVLVMPEVFPNSATPTYKEKAPSADVLNLPYTRATEFGNDSGVAAQEQTPPDSSNNTSGTSPSHSDDHSAEPRCGGCTKPLWASVSIERGLCENASSPPSVATQQIRTVPHDHHLRFQPEDDWNFVALSYAPQLAATIKTLRTGGRFAPRTLPPSSGASTRSSPSSWLPRGAGMTTPSLPRTSSRPPMVTVAEPDL